MHLRMIKKKIFNGKPAPQAKFLKKKMRRRPDFVTKSWWVLCPVDIECNLFSTNHISESFSF